MDEVGGLVQLSLNNRFCIVDVFFLHNWSIIALCAHKLSNGRIVQFLEHPINCCHYHLCCLNYGKQYRDIQKSLFLDKHHVSTGMEQVLFRFNTIVWHVLSVLLCPVANYVRLWCLFML